MQNPSVTVKEITDREKLGTTSSPTPIDLGGEYNLSAALHEIVVNAIRRASRREDGRVFLLAWEGRKIPRGAQILGHTIVWTRNGQVTAEIAGQSNRTESIGSYDRLEEFGGADGNSQKMLVYLSPKFHPQVVVTPS